MKVDDLKNHIYGDKIVLYTKSDDNRDEFKNLYSGKIENIPDILLNYKVRIIGAKRKNVLDISVVEN